MNKHSLKHKLAHLDLESEGGDAIAVDAILNADNNLGTMSEEDIIQTEKEIVEAQDAIDSTYGIVVDTREQIESILENIDEMKPEEIKEALATVKESANQILDEVDIIKVDAEAFDNDPVGVGRIEAEGILDSIKGKFKDLTDAFRSNKSLLEDAFKNSSTSWKTTNQESIDKALDVLQSKSGNIKSGISKVPTKLVTIESFGVSIKDLPSFATSLIKLPVQESETTSIDKQVSKVFTDKRILKNDFIKVSRLNGGEIAAAVIGVTNNVVGYRDYISDSIDSKLSKDVKENGISSKDITLANAKLMLDTAKKINDTMPTIANFFKGEISKLDDELKKVEKGETITVTEDNKAGVASKFIGNSLYIGGLLLSLLPLFPAATIGKIAYKVGSGISKTALGVLKAGKSVSAATKSKTIADAASKVSGKASTALGKASSAINKKGNEIAVRTTMNTKETLVVGAAGLATQLAGDAISKDGIPEEKEVTLTNTQMVKITRDKVKLTSRYAKDAVYGLNALVNDLVGTANNILNALEDK